MAIEKPTNTHFSRNYGHFLSSCEIIGIKSTSRQASKWRNKKGRAWNEGRLKLKENKRLNKQA